MEKLLKIAIAAIMLSFFTYPIMSQELEYLPPVINVKTNKDTGTSLLLNTLDFARDEHQIEIKPYTFSIQIVDADESWPPRWYTAKPVYTDEMFANDMTNNTRHVNFIENPEINGNYIFYLQIFPLNKYFDTTKTFDVQHSAFLAVLDRNLDLVDSIACGRVHGGEYGPGFKKDPKIEILTILRMDTVMDWRKLSGNINDSAVDCEYGLIRILDTKNNVKYVWNPIAHMNLDLFQTRDKLGGLPPSSGPGQLRDIRWMKLSSIGWDYDGDILYGVEDVGIGKISRADGHIIWQLNYSDVPFIPGKDTLECYSPYDFKLIQDNKNTSVYSFYERGRDIGPNGRGVVFEQNKKTKKIRLVKYVWPEKKYNSGGHGGFDYNPRNGDFVVDYGVFDHPDTLKAGFWDVFEYGKGDSTYSIYQIPTWNYTFGVHRLENIPRPPRPLIKKRGDMLEAEGNAKQWTWYKLSGPRNTVITKAGTGPDIRPEKGAIYCVASPYGCGYAVSKPFHTAISPVK